MKSLNSFLNEHLDKKYTRRKFKSIYLNEDESSTEDFTFDASVLSDNMDELAKDLESIDSLSLNDSTITITATKGDPSKSQAAVDKVNQLISAANNTGKRASDEQFAQKIRKIEKTMSSLESFVNSSDEGE